MFSAGSPDKNSTIILPELTAGGSVVPSNPCTDYESIANTSIARLVTTILPPLFTVSPALSV